MTKSSLGRRGHEKRMHIDKGELFAMPRSIEGTPSLHILKNVLKV